MTVKVGTRWARFRITAEPTLHRVTYVEEAQDMPETRGRLNRRSYHDIHEMWGVQRKQTEVSFIL